ncbi:hypothetical protein C0216_08295 [Streptomyces globosus]|uniref:Insulinase family protein n=1 Tax=Streptomyces globosus TaxID=68209 RepID=A0A344TXU5_9ACTN|nr:pitrilysin family protein [Streptomyces globosus]AXE23466.1 hypothetical protein C0216_08295 [Streptomyces globosus]
MTDGSTGIRRLVLGNGLRVVVDTAPGVGLTAVAVHYGAGFRSEPEGRAGLAHLLEHMMFEGSEHFPDRAYFTALMASGGAAEGTTHQDYTDYVHTVPAAALGRALAAEADRMRAPRFTAASLTEQLAGVEAEIRAAGHDSPLGVLPWPLLAGLMYDRWANAHDGYGDLPALARLTPADCTDFFRAHYTPGNAVVTVSGGGEPDEVGALVARHFSGVPAGPAAPARPALAEPPLAADRTAVRRLARGGAVTVGYRLPDPAADLDDYLDRIVAARLLTTPAADAGCGFFGPLDALDPDTLVIALPAADEDGARAALDGLDAALAELAGAGLADRRVQEAAERLAQEHLRDHHGPAARARALGRLEILFGRPGLLDELPARLRAVSTDRVRAAARAMTAQHRAVLALLPGGEPVPFRGLRAAGAPAAGPGSAPVTAGRAAAGAGSRAGSRRSTDGQAGPGLPAYAESGTGPGPGRPAVAAVRDARAPLVELRLRLPAPAGAAPADRERLALVLADRWAARHPRSGPARATVESGAVLLEAWLPAPAPHPAALAGLLAEPPTPAELATAEPRARARMGSRVTDPAWLAEQALRRRILGAEPAPAAAPGLPCAGGIELTAVGDLDPDAWTAAAAEALRPLAAGIAAPPRPPAAAAEGLALLRLPPGVPADASELLWAAPESAAAGSFAARWLAVAVVGGSQPGARLPALRTAAAPYGFHTYAGRFGDHAGTGPLIQVRARLPHHGAAEAAAAVREELRRTGTAPPTEAEADAARRYCAGQFALVPQTQAALADQLSGWLASGRRADEFAGFPAALYDVPADDVARTCAALFAQPAYAGVLAAPATHHPAEETP